MNIGITIGISKENESLWINGIKLNILNLVKTLSLEPSHNVYVVDTSKNVNDLSKVQWDTNKYPIYKLKEKELELDVLIMLGTTIPEEYANNLKQRNPKLKIVKYQCGNNYVIDMEKILFADQTTDSIPSICTYQDETWYVPQQGYQNHDYYISLFRQDPSKVKPVPFVWDPEHMDNLIQQTNQVNVHYSAKKDKKKILVMEPNMNVVKFSMVPMLMVEMLYRKVGDVFDMLTIAGGDKILKNNYYKRIIANLDIVKSKPPKIKYIARYPVTTLLSNETDVIISHQWENPLNYAYLDALYYGYPLIHNADFIKDAGYYYEGFNILQGSEILEDVLANHDKRIEEYKDKNNQILDRYIATNPKLVNTYKKLIDNLFDPNSHKLSYEYCYKKNNYK